MGIAIYYDYQTALYAIEYSQHTMLDALRQQLLAVVGTLAQHNTSFKSMLTSDDTGHLLPFATTTSPDAAWERF